MIKPITIKFEITGIAPLKMDRLLDLPVPKTKDGYLKQAEEKCYRNASGELSIPTQNLKAVIKEAASELGGKKSKQNRQTISSGVFFSDEFCTLNKIKHDGIIQNHVTRGKGEKVTRVMTYRPLIKDWKCECQSFLIGVQPDFIRECLDLGGLRFGLMGHRPEFGRFIVTQFGVQQKE